MHGGLTAASLLRDPLQARVNLALDGRLDRSSPAPVALGLSGGGDSLALLHLASDWCARAGRPLLALTVDHGLSPESAGWTARAGHMAAEAGAAWRALAWSGPKPTTGLPAAARAARHALLAEAARGAGACVLLLAHTADDRAEEAAMRACDAPGLGRLRAWAPSPAWPGGRSMFLLRPLLEVSREELRGWLRERRLAWLEDPANADPRFARARVRITGTGAPSPVAELPPSFGFATADGRVRLPRDRLATGDAAARRSLRAALACASGGGAVVGGGPLDRLLARFAGGGAVTATLGGARLLAEGEAVEVGRETGRRPPADLALAPGRPAVWDGRFEATVAEPGWSVGAAAGRMARLPAQERAALAQLPAGFRGVQPVFVRGAAARLVGEGRGLRCLVAARFDAAVGRVGDEAALRASAEK